MVGVPRSKACNTCRIRKIACTQERPQCRQCLKSNRICTGYQRDRIFVTDQGSPGEGTAGYKAPNRLFSCRSGDSQGTYLIPYSGRQRKHGRIIRSQTIPTPLPRSVSPHLVHRKQLYNLFICSHIPVDMRQPGGQCVSNIWLLALEELPSWTKALEASVLAFSTARLGRLNGDQALIQESLRLYTKGIVELQRALWDPSLMRNDQTLAACFALSLYEVTECASESGQGYVSHHNGCAKLIQLRGADSHSSGLGHEIFTAFRIQGIVQALAVHQPTFLTDPPWTDSPWKNISQNPYDRILGLFARLPDILKQLDDVKRVKPYDLAASLELVDRCWKLDADLALWHKKYEEQIPRPSYWERLSADEELSDLFPVVFQFVNLVVAHLWSLSWAALVILWAAMCELYRIVSTSPDQQAANEQAVEDLAHQASNLREEGNGVENPRSDTKRLPPLEHRLHWPDSVATYICQASEYCMQDEMMGLGPASAVPPLMIVAENLKVFSEGISN